MRRRIGYSILVFLLLALVLLVVTKLFWTRPSEQMSALNATAMKWNLTRDGMTKVEILRIMGPPTWQPTVAEAASFDHLFNMTAVEILEWQNVDRTYHAEIDKNGIVVGRYPQVDTTGMNLVEEPTWLEKLFRD
jgi:outer membrane protein assembly factor BamE (lipoprotein component of BamABCDE complex)